MAAKSKVNVKFVATLTVVLSVAAIGLLATAFFVLTHSGAELERMGDQAMAEKDFKNAITYYGKSFADDQASIPRLTKYCNSMLAYTPENQSLYADYYWKRYIPAKRMLASLLKSDVGQQREILDILLRNMYESGYDRRGWDQVIDIANTSIAPFEAGAQAPGWELLKRYRALAWLEIAGNEPGLDERQAEAIEADFKTVTALDPDDERAAIGLVNWYNLNASRALDAGRTSDEADFRAKALATLDAYRAAHPDSVEAALTALALKVEAAAREADPKKFSPEVRLKMMRDAAAKLQPEVSAVIELVRRVGPEKVDSGTLYRVDRLERFAFDEKASQSRELMFKAIELAPARADLRFMAGRLAEDGTQFEEAIAQYQAILELPIPTLSLEGIMLYQQRLASMARQAEAAMGIWESLNKPEQKQEQEKALARVVDFRKKLAAEVPPSNLELLLIDAKIAYASGDFGKAQMLLQDHLRQTNQSDADSVRLAGIVAMRLNQPGAARDLFVRLIELQPTSPRAKMLKADVEGSLENHEAALSDYREVLNLDPENEIAKERVQQLTRLLSGTSSDPVELTLMEASNLWTGAASKTDRRDAADSLERIVGPISPALRNSLYTAGFAPDREAAIALIELASNRFPDDIRVIRMRATYYYNVGRIDEARAVCTRGLALAPDNQELKNLNLILQAKDQYDAGQQLIDASPATPIQKLIAKVQLARRYDKAEDANRFLAEAVAMAPNEPAVIEFRFTDAITRNSIESIAEAKEIADQAAAADLDKLKGATYRARILVVEGNKADAIEVLKGATQTGTVSPEVWRFLGQVQAELGQETRNTRLSEDALASFYESLRMRPNDLGTIVDTLRTLVHLGRLEPALDLARKNEALGRGSAEFRDLWLRLEASEGDANSKIRAVMIRRALLKDQPANDVNKVALLQSDIDLASEGSGADPVIREEARAEARMLLDSLRATPTKAATPLLLTQLDARLRSDHGDRDGARQVYLDFIASQKAANVKLGPEPYVAMAQFLVGIGDTQGGLDTLQEARQFQDPKTLEVDRTLGMILFDLGKLEECLPILAGFLASGCPDDLPAPYAVRARHAETLLRLKRYADAESSLDAAGPEANATITLMLLRAGAREGLGDEATARKLIDEAIVKYPNDPLGYVKRAELTSEAAESIDDAVADLDTAIRLKPDMWNALQLRALLKIRQNRQEEAMDDLKQVVKGNPGAPGPRNALLQALVESGKFEEALDIANLAANQRPRDVALLMSLGDLFNSYTSQRPEALGAAVRYYDRAWKLGPNPRVAIIYTRALLRTRNDRNAVELAGQILGTPGLNTDQNPELLMNRAIVLNRQGAFDRSRAEAAQALQLVITSPGDTSAMLDQLAPVFGDPFNNKGDMAALISFVQNLDMSGLPDMWADFFRARYKILDPLAKEEALSNLRQVVDGAKDATLQKVARQFLSAALISSGDKAAAEGDRAAASALYEEALQIINGALELDPSNAEALNNGAYVLTENLKRPQDALPMAERAVQLRPDAGPFWDTLGLIYLELGRFDDADKALNKAAAAGGNINERMQIAIKLVRVKIGKKDYAAGQKILDDANKATGRIPELKAAYQGQLDALQRELTAAR